MVALRDVAATSQCDVASKSPGEVAATSQGRPKVMSKSPWRCRCDIAHVTLLRCRKDTLTATSGKVAATSLRSPWRPKWLRFAMSPRRRNATSPRSHNGNVPATSLLRYRLKVATAMSPQYCHGDVAAMSQSASEFSQKSPRRCCRDVAQVTLMRLESPRQCCHAIAAILPLLTCMY